MRIFSLSPDKFYRMLRTLLSLTFIFGYSAIQAQTYYVDDAVNAGIDHYSSFGYNEYAMGGGVAWLDFNNDGWLDLYLTGGYQQDFLYLNNQNSTFTDVSVSAGIVSSTMGVMTNGVSVADVNRDGFEDILVTTNHMSANLLFINQGDGSFVESANSYGIDDVAFSTGVAIGDVNQDGWPDLYYANWRILDEFGGQLDEAHEDRFFINNGNGSFTDATAAYGLLSSEGCGLAVCFSDFDLDGDPDLLVANDFGFEPWTEENELFRNDQGQFTDISVSSGFNLAMNAMGFAAADYDEDQDLDYYVTNVGLNGLLRNEGTTFDEVAVLAGVDSQWPHPDSTSGEESWSWGAGFFDYDNDTYVDLFSANGFIHAQIEAVDMSRMFRNLNASGTFEDVTIPTGLGDPNINRGFAFGDYDNDGDVDVFLATQDTAGGFKRSQLLENVGATANWIGFRLTGVTSNLDALGSVVYVYVDGRTLIREMDSGGASFNSHHSKIIHFGLGQYASVDSIRVVWPNGNAQLVTSPAINQYHDITEQTEPNSILSLHDSGLMVFPNPTEDKITLTSAGSLAREYKIFDMVGKLMQRGSITSNSSTHQISLDGFEAGIYNLVIGERSMLISKQ